VKNPLIINRLNLKEGGQQLHLKISAEDLDIKALKIIGPVDVNLDITTNDELIIIAGNVTFRAKLNCVSCLEDFEKDYSEEIYQEFVSGTKPKIVFEGRIEGADFNREYYSGDQIDLTSLIYDTVHLAIPIAPWCKDDCPDVSI